MIGIVQVYYKINEQILQKTLRTTLQQMGEVLSIGNSKFLMTS